MACDFFWEGAQGDGGMRNVNWGITQRPHALGGLGIGNFKLRNSSLLAKWTWRFLIENDALWRNLIVAKYYGVVCYWPTLISNASYKAPWKSISHCIGLVTDCIRQRIGNGSTTSFWNDSWLNCGVLSTAFPRLFCLTQLSEATMANVWISSSNAWDLNLRRNLIELEIAEWASLSHHLAFVRLTSSPDAWIWPWTHLRLNLSWRIWWIFLTQL